MDWVPKPLSETFSTGVVGSELLIASTVLRLPMAVGLNVRLTVQVLFGLRPTPAIGQALVCAKSPALPPVRVMLLMISEAVPLLVIVNVCGVVVVFTVMLPNVIALGVGLITGAVPVPLNGTDNAVGLELAMLIVAARAPVAVGV